MQISVEGLDYFKDEILLHSSYLGDENEAMQLLDTLRYWNEGFQRLGFSQNSPLTANEETVEEFLLELVAKFTQRLAHHALQTLITTNINVSALVDVLTGLFCRAFVGNVNSNKQ